MHEDKWFVKDKKGKERTGVLMRLEESEHSRYEFEVWFEYTRQAMNDIREGTMLAVPNYATTREETHYSIIEVTSLKPIHYAIGENPVGFPGFVIEAAKNAAQDWTGQDDEPTEDTTTIQCTAIPTNLELVEGRDGTRIFQPEENVPMVGAVARILDTEPMKQVVNRDIDMETEKDVIFVGGMLIRDERVPAYVRIEDFVRAHFGIFGFTGAGKSNLLSTYIAKLLDSPQVVKVVLFDLMGEYTALLVDLLNTMSSSYVVCIGERTLPEPVFEYLNVQDKSRRSSYPPAEIFSRFTLLPKALKPYQAQVTVALQRLIESNKVRVYQAERSLTVYNIFYDSEKSLMNYGSRLGPAKSDQLKTLIKRLNPTDGRPSDVQANQQVVAEILKRIQKEKDGTTQDYKDFKQYLDPFEGWLRLVEGQLGRRLYCGIDMNQLIRELESPDRSSLVVVTSHDPNQLRTFAKEFGEAAFETRRKSGNITPLVSFIFDEADEFIPQEDVGTYKDSRAVVETLARRGRKFGLGVGIATQRTRYLDTSIMAQPHTYRVSKLPRKSDREVVAEAFGTSEDMFRQTFKFKPGNWLLMSHDATGLKAVPIPIQTADANERVRKYLESLQVETPKAKPLRLF
jgi:DNA helicase HerA-like ATPase